eukprot:Phypoly_transcript_11788.p1 GENE.Phypoly_transcript_11788~~Phypoly_transcript_11788.p1  ORF type:complete len:317 (+),score=50.49 Phypoly_transcript_11788:198-1148(+)
MKSVILIITLLFSIAFAVPSSKSFTTDVEVVEFDGSVGKVTWVYDATSHAERLIHHRQGVPTTNIRLYAQNVEYLVVENECYKLPLDSAMPTPSERVASLSNDKALLRWINTVVGSVYPTSFAIPSSCASVDELGNGTFCPTCLSIGNQVVSLGCNASAQEIASLCGDVFASLCKQILVTLCDGTCQIETCAADACCLFDLCSGSPCNGSSSNTETEEAIFIDETVNDGVFCPSCLSVGASVISLGCNATAAEIANLCGNLFAPVCKSVLETACSGVCSIEACASQACCLFDLCSGSTCNSSIAETEPSGAVPLLL